MLTAVVLICSVAVTPNLQDCGLSNARTVIRAPTEFANPVACLMQGQAVLAGTSLGQELADDDRVKILCVRTATLAGVKQPSRPMNLEGADAAE
jgi:hypothetical protein